jgi:hypothetical protein
MKHAATVMVSDSESVTLMRLGSRCPPACWAGLLRTRNHFFDPPTGGTVDLDEAVVAGPMADQIAQKTVYMTKGERLQDNSLDWSGDRRAEGKRHEGLAAKFCIG